MPSSYGMLVYSGVTSAVTKMALVEGVEFFNKVEKMFCIFNV